MTEGMLEAVDFSNVQPGDTVKRIFGTGFMVTTMRVSAVDDDFIYCDAQNEVELPPGSAIWKFDRVYGVETDEEQRWGVAYGLMMSRIEPQT